MNDVVAAIKAVLEAGAEDNAREIDVSFALSKYDRENRIQIKAKYR